MGFIKHCKDTVKKFDFFYSTQIFKYQEQLEYKTLTGGILSIGIIATICVAFFSMISETMERKVYITSIETTKSSDPTMATISTFSESKFMFAISIWEVNLTDTMRYFDIYLYSFDNQPSYLTLQACTEEHWKSFPSFLEAYDVTQFLCPPLNKNLNIQGKFSSKTYHRHTIYVSYCKNTTDTFNNSTCHPQNDIDNLFSSNKNSLGFSVFYSTPIINQNEKQYKSYHVEDQSYNFFGPSLGSENYLYFTDYSVKSDESIFPFEDIKLDSGLLVEQVASRYPYQMSVDNSYYVIFNFVKSANSLKYKRQVQKLSAVFSFIGGSIAAISGVMFIIKLYTQFAFSITLAYNLFERQEQQMDEKRKNDLSNINFLEYFRFALFSLFKMIGRSRPDWKEANYIDKCSKEIDKHLDIRTLLQRLIFIQFCITYIFQDYQLEGLQLKRPKTADQIKKTRQKCLSVIDKDEIQQTKTIIKSRKTIQDLDKDKQKHQESEIQSKLSDKIADQINETNKQCIPSKIMQNFKDQKKVMITVQGIQKQDEQSGDNFNNKILDIFLIEKKKQQLLCKLKIDAKKGEKLSVKIWQKFSDTQVQNLTLKQESF